MDIVTSSGSAGTPLFRTELVQTARPRTGALCGQVYGEMAARVNRAQVLALDVTEAGVAASALRPQFHQIPTNKQQWRLPPCSRERRL